MKLAIAGFSIMSFERIQPTTVIWGTIILDKEIIPPGSSEMGPMMVKLEGPMILLLTGREQ